MGFEDFCARIPFFCQLEKMNVCLWRLKEERGTFASAEEGKSSMGEGKIGVRRGFSRILYVWFFLTAIPGNPQARQGNTVLLCPNPAIFPPWVITMVSRYEDQKCAWGSGRSSVRQARGACGSMSVRAPPEREWAQGSGHCSAPLLSCRKGDMMLPDLLSVQEKLGIWSFM